MTDATFGMLKMILYIMAFDYLDRHPVCAKVDSIRKGPKQTADSGYPSSRASDLYDCYDLGLGHVGKHRDFWA